MNDSGESGYDRANNHRYFLFMDCKAVMNATTLSNTCRKL